VQQRVLSKHRGNRTSALGNQEAAVEELGSDYPHRSFLQMVIRVLLNCPIECIVENRTRVSIRTRIRTRERNKGTNPALAVSWTQTRQTQSCRMRRQQQSMLRKVHWGLPKYLRYCCRNQLKSHCASVERRLLEHGEAQEG